MYLDLNTLVSSSAEIEVVDAEIKAYIETNKYYEEKEPWDKGLYRCSGLGYLLLVLLCAEGKLPEGMVQII